MDLSMSGESQSTVSRLCFVNFFIWEYFLLFSSVKFFEFGYATCCLLEGTSTIMATTGFQPQQNVIQDPQPELGSSSEAFTPPSRSERFYSRVINSIVESSRQRRFSEFLTDIGKRTLEEGIPTDKHLFPDKFHEKIKDEMTTSPLLIK